MLFGQRNRWRVSSICMIMSSLSGFSILAGTICIQTLLETCYLIWCVKRQGSWYKKLYDTSIAIPALPCNRAFRCMLFNANNITVISWWSFLLMEETRVPRGKHQHVASHWQTLSHNVVYILHVKDSQQ